MPPPTNAPTHATPTRLVDALVSALTPVRPAPSWPAATAGWLAAAVLVVVTALVASGPFRPDFLASLATPRLGLEIGLGVLAALALAAIGLERDVPGAPRTLRLAGPLLALAVAAVWVALLAAPIGSLDASGLTGPAAGPTGKRAHCFVEGLVFAALPIGLAMVALRRRALAPRGSTGAVVGLAAGVLVATGMQLACQWDPVHALRFHAGLAGPLALASALIVRFALPRD